MPCLLVPYLFVQRLLPCRQFFPTGELGRQNFSNLSIASRSLVKRVGRNTGRLKKLVQAAFLCLERVDFVKKRSELLFLFKTELCGGFACRA